jgi:uncharacterized protein (UPF0261 family)
VAVVVVDAGVLDEPLVEPDVTRRGVAETGGADVEQLAAARDPRAALAAMRRRAAEIIRRLCAEGRLDGVAGLGGTGGFAVTITAMRALPLGAPKLMVSTVAAGDTRRVSDAQPRLAALGAVLAASPVFPHRHAHGANALVTEGRERCRRPFPDGRR